VLLGGITRLRSHSPAPAMLPRANARIPRERRAKRTPHVFLSVHENGPLLRAFGAVVGWDSAPKTAVHDDIHCSWARRFQMFGLQSAGPRECPAKRGTHTFLSAHEKWPS